ncbi:unnamed protein product [Haemonchus placei]|uniref:Transposase n=1 Tax=Haemonchus placei TaxID=6290 RepID=A0A0N4X236_HAEPC|nr:unnamed protein product [Haemonchus placei]
MRVTDQLLENNFHNDIVNRRKRIAEGTYSSERQTFAVG